VAQWCLVETLNTMFTGKQVSFEILTAGSEKGVPV